MDLPLISYLLQSRDTTMRYAVKVPTPSPSLSPMNWSSVPFLGPGPPPPCTLFIPSDAVPGSGSSLSSSQLIQLSESSSSKSSSRLSSSSVSCNPLSVLTFSLDWSAMAACSCWYGTNSSPAFSTSMSLFNWIWTSKEIYYWYSKITWLNLPVLWKSNIILPAELLL